jgi:hypothetical protein
VLGQEINVHHAFARQVRHLTDTRQIRYVRPGTDVDEDALGGQRV